MLSKLPDEWLVEENDILRVRNDRAKDLPEGIVLAADGSEDEHGLACHFITAPFRFCLHCGVSYDYRQGDDFAKLATLSSEGRSTATTILSLSAIRNLRHQLDLPVTARKLLSFTDNRQDASLQAGHFNDFVEIGLLRGPLYAAVRAAGGAGLHHEELTQRVFDILRLPVEMYASNPSAKYQALAETQRA